MSCCGPMKHVTIPLSDAHHAALEARVSDGDYASVADYVTALVDAETRARAQDRLDELLLEGLRGEATPWTREDAERLKRLALTGE